MRVALSVPRSRESNWSPLAHGSHTPLLFSQVQTPCTILQGVCFCPPYPVSSPEQLQFLPPSCRSSI